MFRTATTSVHALLVCYLCGVIVTLGNAAHAQSSGSDSAAVLVVDASDTDAVDIAPAVVQALQMHGTRLWTRDEAWAALATLGHGVSPDHRFEAEASSVTGLRVAVETILEDVAYARYAQAIDRGRKLLAELDPTVPLLAQDPNAAGYLGDVCLLVARALLKQGHDADEQVLDCLRRVPDLAPDPALHPPQVLARVQQVRAASRTPWAQVDLRVVGTEPCTWRLQGRPIGHGRQWTTRAMAGALTVQAQCANGSTWLHTVEVDTAQPVQLELDVALETAVRIWREEQRFLQLTGGFHRPQMLAARIQRSLGSATVFLLSSDGESYRLHRWIAPTEDTPTLLSQLELPHDAAPEQWTAHVGPWLGSGATARDRSVARRALANPPAPPVLAEVSPTASSRAPAPALGLLVGGMGALAVAGSWMLYNRWTTQHRDVPELSSPPTVEETDLVRSATARRNVTRNRAVALSGAGSLALALSVPLWLPEGDGLLWWSVGAGVIGTGLGVVGGTLWARHGSLQPSEACPDCVERRQTLPLAPLLVFNGAALLSLPLTQALRWLFSTPQTLQPRVDLQPGHVGIGLAGYL